MKIYMYIAAITLTTSMACYVAEGDNKPLKYMAAGATTYAVTSMAYNVLNKSLPGAQAKALVTVSSACVLYTMYSVSRYVVEHGVNGFEFDAKSVSDVLPSAFTDMLNSLKQRTQDAEAPVEQKPTSESTDDKK